MSAWDAYPTNYRSREVNTILSAVLAGECVSVIGLSGAGKSNLMCFLANRIGMLALPGIADVPPEPGAVPPCRFVLVDCNRLPKTTPEALLRLIRHVLGDAGQAADELQALDSPIAHCLASPSHKLSLLVDRFDSLAQLVRRLREKIEPDPSAPRYIPTIPGRGYRFTP